MLETSKKRFEAVLELEPNGRRTLYDVEACDLRDAWKQLKIAVLTRTGIEILPGFFAEKDVNVFMLISGNPKRFHRMGRLRELNEALPPSKKIS